MYFDQCKKEQTSFILLIHSLHSNFKESMVSIYFCQYMFQWISFDVLIAIKIFFSLFILVISMFIYSSFFCETPCLRELRINLLILFKQNNQTCCFFWFLPFLWNLRPPSCTSCPFHKLLHFYKHVTVFTSSKSLKSKML